MSTFSLNSNNFPGGLITTTFIASVTSGQAVSVYWTGGDLGCQLTGAFGFYPNGATNNGPSNCVELVINRIA